MPASAESDDEIKNTHRYLFAIINKCVLPLLKQQIKQAASIGLAWKRTLGESTNGPFSQNQNRGTRFISWPTSVVYISIQCLEWVNVPSHNPIPRKRDQPYEFIFVFHCKLTTDISCIVAEIKRNIGWKSRFYTPFYTIIAPPSLGKTVAIIPLFVWQLSQIHGLASGVNKFCKNSTVYSQTQVRYRRFERQTR